MKRKLIQMGGVKGHATCPRCKVKDAAQIALVGPKKHIRAWCTTEGCKFSSMLE